LGRAEAETGMDAEASVEIGTNWRMRCLPCLIKGG
jgi:hypothetical protein